MQKVSYIFPIYNEAGNIDLLHSTMAEIVSVLPYEMEFIFINDGSKDDSLARLLRLQEVDPRVRVVDFSRNFGHQMAVTAGLDLADGDAVIIMDSDMQDPPAVSLELIKEWENGYDVVYAQRRSRQDGAFKRLTASAFYRVLHALADIDIPRDTGDFRLLDRKVVLELRKYREHDRFLRGMVSHVGFRQTAVQFDRHARHAGVTGYPLRKMLKFAADGIFGFSSKPITLISRVGYVIAAMALVGIVYAVVLKIFFPDHAVQGWAFIIITLLALGGLQLIMLGVVGRYVGRIYLQVQGRPLYSIRSIHGLPADGSPARGSIPPDLLEVHPALTIEQTR